jgi:hypothetical protein
MTEIGEVGVRRRRSRQEIKRLVAEFESVGCGGVNFVNSTAAASGMAYRTGAIISVQRSRTGCCYLYRAYAISFAKTVVNRKSPVLF